VSEISPGQKLNKNVVVDDDDDDDDDDDEGQKRSNFMHPQLSSN